MRTDHILRSSDTLGLRRIAAALLVILVVFAYRESVTVPFLFDDSGAVLNNPSIRDPARFADVLSPPPDGSGVTGRPIVNLSLALNYALGEFDPRGYHIFNVLVHTIAALVIFRLILQTLALAGLSSLHPVPFAFSVACTWALHPIQTESVICVIQRTEVLLGLFYLLTLYLFSLSIGSPRSFIWKSLSVAACLLGMGTKEVMVSAPLAVLCYDRAFVSGSFAAAWRQNLRYYVCLGSTWLLLVFLLVSMGGSRGAAAGFGLGVSVWDYALTQFEALTTYLRLMVWPHPLILDYGIDLITTVGAVAPKALFVLTLVGAAFVAFHRRPVIGTIGLWCVALLAPSSSVIPLITQTLAEHRMYLPSLPLITLGMGALYYWIPRQAPFLAAGISMALLCITIARTKDYQDPVRIWADTIAKRPANARAHYNLAVEVSKRSDANRALLHLQRAVEIDPAYADAHHNLAYELAKIPGREPEAESHYIRAFTLNPNRVEARHGLGRLLQKMGRNDLAIAQYQAAVRIRPDHFDAMVDLANALASEPGRVDEALFMYKSALRMRPSSPLVHNNLATFLGRDPRRRLEAIAYFRRAVQLAPDDPEIRYNFANLLAKEEESRREAIAEYEAALRLRPNFVEAMHNLGYLLGQRTDSRAEAIAYLEKVRQLRPGFITSRRELARLYLEAQRPLEALQELESLLTIEPAAADIRQAYEQLKQLLRRN